MSNRTAVPMDAKRTVVGISQMQVSDDIEDTLITYSLGSCIGVSIYDPERHIGGMIHCMLPLSKIDPEKAELHPAMFVDTGLLALLEALLKKGANMNRLIVKLAGAASALAGGDRFRVGERNCTVLRKLLWKNDLLIDAEDIGGTRPRTMTLCLASGKTAVQTAGEAREL